MRKITNCFFATTPYQIMSAINLAMNSGESSDLYIFNQFATADEVAEKVRATGLFEKVKVVDNDSTYSKFTKKTKNRNLQTILFLLELLKCHRSALDVFDKEDVYEVMYASVPNLYYRVLQLHLNKYKTKLYMYDDGLGSYTSILIVRKRKIDKIVQKVFFHRDLFKESVKYLYSPQLYKQLNNDDDVIIKIPNMYNDERYRQIVMGIFGSETIDEPVIIIDTVKDQLMANEEEIKKAKAMYQYAYDTLGYNNVVCKRHPRDKSPEDPQKKYMDNSIPFETSLLKNNMENKIFITIN